MVSYLENGEIIKARDIDLSGGKRFNIPDEEAQSLRAHIRYLAKKISIDQGGRLNNGWLLALFSIVIAFSAFVMPSPVLATIFFTAGIMGIIAGIIIGIKTCDYTDMIINGAGTLEYYEFTVDNIYYETIEARIVVYTRYYAKFNGIIMYLGTLEPSIECGSTIALAVVRCGDRLCVAHTREIPNKTPYIGQQNGEGQWNLKK